MVLVAVSMVKPMPGRGRAAEEGVLASSTMRFGDVWEGESGERRPWEGESGERRLGPLLARGRYSQSLLLMMLLVLVVLLPSSSFVFPETCRDKGLPTRGLLLPPSNDGLVRKAGSAWAVTW